MKNIAPKVIVIGLGGIGGITAANASRAGFDVEVVDNLPGLSEKIEKEGIEVSGTMAPFTEKITAYNSISKVPGKKDIILLATKATALCDIAEEIKSLMNDTTVVVSLQNGMCEEFLMKILGRNRVLGCVVGWGATVHKPGKLEKTSEGNFVIGTLPGEHVLGKMLAIKKIRNIFIEIICEAVLVGSKAGIRIEKYAGRLDFYTFAENGSVLAKFMKHLKIRIIGMKYSKLKSSSLQSLETGRKTEIDFLNGYIVDKGNEVHVSTPLNDLLVSLVKDIEEGRRTISYDNFKLSAFSRY
jgi:2-dehydropantoate 2-reductase